MDRVPPAEEEIRSACATIARALSGGMGEDSPFRVKRVTRAPSKAFWRKAFI